MLWIYDLLCNGLRDPHDVAGDVWLSWRLGAERDGAQQLSCRVVVVSLLTGNVMWDTGEVLTDNNVVRYGGVPQMAGVACSWFVTVIDELGEQTQSIPAAFVWGQADDLASSELGAQCLALAWCSDEELSRAWEGRRLVDADGALDADVWHDVLGVCACGLLARHVCVEPKPLSSLEFAYGSVLLSRGLMVVGWERTANRVRLEVTLPPGVVGELCLCDMRREVPSGRHALEVALQ